MPFALHQPWGFNIFFSRGMCNITHSSTLLESPNFVSDHVVDSMNINTRRTRASIVSTARNQDSTHRHGPVT